MAKKKTTSKKTAEVESSSASDPDLTETAEVAPPPEEAPKKEAPKKGGGVSRDDPFLQEVVKRPLGADGRTIALALQVVDRGKAFTELNALCDAGLVRKRGSVYYPTPKGATFAAGQ